MKQPNYENYAFFYDQFELAGYGESEGFNQFLEELFHSNLVKTVLDFSCGTGAQAIGLARRGFKVTASDLSSAMLDYAKKKAGKLDIEFVNADMRTAKLGKFDAAISIFNSIGHLSKKDCSIFLKNACDHLIPGGIFVTDIFNFKAMQNGAFDDYKDLSRQVEIEGKLVHHVRHCDLDEETKTITTISRTYSQDGVNDPQIVEDKWEMQIYNPEEIYEMLESAGFSEIKIFGPYAEEFNPLESETMLIFCQK